jgi:hypothetical protein
MYKEVRRNTGQGRKVVYKEESFPGNSILTSVCQSAGSSDVYPHGYSRYCEQITHKGVKTAVS